MKKLFQNLILIVLILFILTSCTGNGTVTPESPGQVKELYLGVPVVKQEKLTWCLPASVQSVLNYAGMESVLNYAGMDITQSEIAKYCMEGNAGSTYILANNAEELGIDVDLKNYTLEEIKEEIIKERPPIVTLDYSFTDPENHAYVIDGFSDIKQEIRGMCPIRGYITVSYDEFKNINDQTWGQECDLYLTTSIWPKDN